MPEDRELSARETEILELLATGMTNREIAQTLYISPNTVKVHVRNIFNKLEVASRTEATFFAIEHGLVDVPGQEDPPAEEAGEDLPAPQSWLRRAAWLGIPLVLVIFVAAFLIGRSAPFSPAAPTAPPGPDLEIPERWQDLSALPEPRAGLAAVSYGNAIYAIAGEGPQGTSASVFRYSLTEDAWEALSQKPTPVSAVEGVLIGEKMYLPGGAGEDGQPTNVLEIYDPRRDQWETGAPMPAAVSAYALTAFEGQLYLFGGWDGQAALDIVLIYDPLSDTWREGSPMPTPRFDAGAAEVNGRIYVMGGWDGDLSLTVNESYVPSRDRNGEEPWTEETPLPHSLYGMGVVRLTDKVFLIGGRSSDLTEVPQIYYSTVEESWLSADSTEKEAGSLLHPAVETVDSYIYVIGGELAGEAVTDARSYRAIYTILLPITTNQ